MHADTLIGWVSLQPLAQPLGGSERSIEWRPLTLSGGGGIKVGTPALARRLRYGSGKLGCYAENPPL
jgi:hypothetical protein